MKLIWWKTPCLIIVGICKMPVNEINIKVRFYNYYCDNLIKEKPLESKNILIDEKNYKDLIIYFTRYVHSKSIKC